MFRGTGARNTPLECVPISSSSTHLRAGSSRAPAMFPPLLLLVGDQAFLWWPNVPFAKKERLPLVAVVGPVIDPGITLW